MDFDRITWWADRVAVVGAFLFIAWLLTFGTADKEPELRNIVRCTPNQAGQYTCEVVGQATDKELGPFAP